jgi:hypothetical protein
MKNLETAVAIDQCWAGWWWLGLGKYRSTPYKKYFISETHFFWTLLVVCGASDPPCYSPKISGAETKYRRNGDTFAMSEVKPPFMKKEESE